MAGQIHYHGIDPCRQLIQNRLPDGVIHTPAVNQQTANSRRLITHRYSPCKHFRGKLRALFITITGYLSVDLIQQPIILTIVFALFGYLLGSVSTAIITCRLMGLADPRTVGSNNPGATNVLRAGGKKAAAITLLGDMLKGLIPVLIAVLLELPEEVVAATGLAAFLGHLYPLYYGFKGGKGVATILGVLLGTHGLLGLATIGLWLGMAATFRYSSLSALVAASGSPILAWYITQSPPITACTAVMATLLIWRHRGNIKKLLAGQEDKIGRKK
jgi:glycerol-3-phosphate acyltransferase PlsY